MAVQSKAEQAFVQEALFSKLPAIVSDRVIGFLDNFNLAVAANICTWLFVTGAFVGMMVPIPIGILITLGMNSIPMLMICLIAKFAAKTGLDQGIHARVSWGTIGSVIMLCALIPIFWGWASIPTVMFGRIVNTVAEYYNIGGLWSSPLLWAAVCLAIGVWLTYGGPTWQKAAFNIATPTMIVLIILITIRMVSYYGWDTLMAAKPAAFVQNPWLSMMLVFELNVGTGVSWLCNQSQWSRLCKTERAAFWPNFLGWGILWGTFAVPGIFVGAIANMGDPVQAMTVIGGVWVPAYLLLLLLANPSSLILELYFISLTLRSMFDKLSWKWAIAISLPPILFLSYWPGAYDTYQKFVTLISSIFMPTAMVWVLDLVLRKFKISMVDVFDTSRKSAYYYWGGINWLAFIATGIGICSSFAIYNPLTAEVYVPTIFNAIGAGIPAGVLSGIIYYILYRILMAPKKIGLPESAS